MLSNQHRNSHCGGKTIYLHNGISFTGKTTYCQVSNIRRTLVGNKIVDHSDVIGA